MVPKPASVGPYTNVLDLSLFPMMSKRHSAKLQIWNSTEASLSRIWETVGDVWNSTSSASVARSFVHAYRVMKLIIHENGNNAWLSEGTPHCGVRQDFVDTDDGIRRKYPLLEMRIFPLMYSFHMLHRTFLVRSRGP